MLVKYQPEGQPAQEWEFKPGRVRASEAQIIERQFGGTWDEFTVGVQQGDTAARRVLLWHLINRTHVVRFADTPDFCTDEVTVEYDSGELAEARQNVERNTGMRADRKEAVLAAIDRQMEEAQAREAAGKAASPTSSRTPLTDSGSSSPQN